MRLWRDGKAVHISHAALLDLTHTCPPFLSLFLQACQPLLHVSIFEGFQQRAGHVSDRVCNPRSRMCLQEKDLVGINDALPHILFSSFDDGVQFPVLRTFLATFLRFRLRVFKVEKEE
jgi:hypothetical protein